MNHVVCTKDHIWGYWNRISDCGFRPWDLSRINETFNKAFGKRNSKYILKLRVLCSCCNLEYIKCKENRYGKRKRRSGKLNGHNVNQE